MTSRSQTRGLHHYHPDNRRNYSDHSLAIRDFRKSVLYVEILYFAFETAVSSARRV